MSSNSSNTFLGMNPDEEIQALLAEKSDNQMGIIALKVAEDCQKATCTDIVWDFDVVGNSLVSYTTDLYALIGRKYIKKPVPMFIMNNSEESKIVDIHC